MKPVFALAVVLTLPASAQDVHIRVDPHAPHADPGNESSLTFPTIQNALDHHPFAGPAPGKDGAPARVFIQIAPGTYNERIIVTQNHKNITLLGTGSKPEDTIITNSLNAKTAGGTFFTETAEINGDGFEADNLTFANTAGNTGQAVAAAIRADRAVFKHVHFLGHQDTLFADYGRQYYTDCFITGGVDYIFGNAAAVFDHSELNSNGPGFITAQSRTAPDQPTGYVILNSRITTAFEPSVSANRTIGLGRPWRAYSRVVYINNTLPVELTPAGWNNWNKAANESTAYYAEFGSTGPGTNKSARAPWAHQLTERETHPYLPNTFLSGQDHWNPTAEAAKLP